MLRKLSVHSKKGFTLAVMAGVLVLIGAVLLNYLPLESKKELSQSLVTQQRLASIKKALNVYYKANSALPGAAAATYETNNANFGVSQAAGACGTLGIVCCVAETAGNTSVLTSCTAGTAVMIGGVPTRSLNLPSEYAFDGWGNRFTYAADTTAAESIGVYSINSSTVTKYKSTSTSPCNAALTKGAAEAGNCLIDDQWTQAGSDREFNAHNQASAVIVSHGANGSARYDRAGNPSAVSCSSLTDPTTATALAANASDRENCDDDSSFVINKRNGAASANYFDDLATYFVKPNTSCSVANPCVAGIASLNSGFVVYSIDTSDSSMKILNNYAAGTSPWYSSVSSEIVDEAKCVYISSSKTGCILMESGNLMAMDINPSTGVTGTSYSASGGTLSSSYVYTDLACTLIDSSGKVFCLASTKATTRASQAFRVDFSLSPPTFTSISSPDTTMAQDLSSSDCVKILGVDQVFCIKTNSKADLFRYDEVSTATSITPKRSTLASIFTPTAAYTSRALSCKSVVYNETAITNITQANPAVVTLGSMPFSAGDYIYLSSVEGMTELNGTMYKVGTVTGNSFNLLDVDGANIDSGSYTAYTSGGTLVQQKIGCIAGTHTNVVSAPAFFTLVWPVDPSASAGLPTVTADVKVGGTSALSYTTGTTGGYYSNPRSDCWNFDSSSATIYCMINGVIGGAAYGGTPSNRTEVFSFDSSTGTMTGPIAQNFPSVNSGFSSCSRAVNDKVYCITSDLLLSNSSYNNGKFFSLYVFDKSGETLTGPVSLGTSPSTPCSGGPGGGCGYYSSYTDFYYYWISGAKTSAISADPPISLAK